MTKSNSKPLILLGLNEINFEYIEHYITHGHLPNLKKLLEVSPLVKTSSEKTHEELEPWIQWVSVQTGQPFSKHKIFRLGDMTDASHTQIWEYIEEKHGVKVAALSPMNAANLAKDPAFFIPDPWTKTKVTGNWLMRKITGAVANAVNENATGGSKLSTYFYLILGITRYSLLSRHINIVLLILKSLRSHYHRAILLDQILTDMFCAHWKKDNVGFSTLFLNGGAHLQHHYLFNAAPYEGDNKNPEWYMPADKDPLLDGLKSYDQLVQQVLSLPNKPRVLVATGLHQNPVEKPVFYWRLKDHETFLDMIETPYTSVQARMSRDFLIEFHDDDNCVTTENNLRNCRDENDNLLFEEIENRGTSLFVSLTYPYEFTENTVVYYDGGEIKNFKDHVGFVAIKNGEHDGEGYIVDSDNEINSKKKLPITDIFSLIDKHFETKSA